MKSIAVIMLVLISFSNFIAQNRFPFVQNDKWFYVDSTMKKVSGKTYSFLLPFQGAYAVVKQNNKYGVIDVNEKVIISFQYDTISFNYAPPFYCIKNKIEIWLDENEKPIPIVRGCGLSSSVSSFWTYKKNKKIGILKFNYPNKTDSLPNIYDELHEYFQGIAIVRIGNKWGTINDSGKTITPISLDSIQVVGNYTTFDIHKPIKYYSGNYLGFINTEGVVITKPKYKDFYFTVRQFTLVRTSDNKLVYIDSKGKEYYK